MTAETLLAEIRELIGANEFAGHEGKWRAAAESNLAALEDATRVLRRALATPGAGPIIRNRGGWLWGGYRRRIGVGSARDGKSEMGNGTAPVAEGGAR